MKWLLFLPLNILFVLSAYILSPLLAAISVVAGVTTLPGFLQWWSTTDDTLDGGQHQHPEIYPSGVTGFALWWQRTRWICRNPAHGWGSVVLGFKDVGLTFLEEHSTGGLDWSGKVSCFYSCKMRDYKGRMFWSWRRNIPVGGYYIKMWFGWNYKAYDGVYHQFEFQPFMIKKAK